MKTKKAMTKEMKVKMTVIKKVIKKATKMTVTKKMKKYQEINQIMKEVYIFKLFN